MTSLRTTSAGLVGLGKSGVGEAAVGELTPEEAPGKFVVELLLGVGRTLMSTTNCIRPSPLIPAPLPSRAVTIALS
jgi:hypothetical protein